MKKIRIALAGQPNVGKSAIINAISNARLKVGNFSGVTVKKEVVQFKKNDYEFEITDLPGSYSLTDFTIEERVTKQNLNSNDYDIILNVVDSTNIERNLYLTTEILILNKKTVVALNMTDEAIKEGVEIDADQLSKVLGVNCIKTSATEKTGMEELLEAIVQTFEASKKETRLQFSDPYEEEISRICSFLKDKNYKSDIDFKTIAINLLKEDKETFQKFHDEPLWIEMQPVLIRAYEHLYLHFNSKDLDDIFNEEKTALAKGAVAETVVFKKQDKNQSTGKIDDLLMNKFLGLPIFLLLMWGLFKLTFVIGSIPMDWIDGFFGWMGDSTKTILGDTELASVIADGAIAGVGAVVLFLPNIIILFIGIALLETTGYMSRVAFLLDGIFHKFGMHGKSFIPLVTGFGCSVPAYMAARTLKNDRDRLLTLFIIGFMSCGAKLPIYVLFVGALFPEEHAANVLWLIYISGAILGLFAAKILKMTAFKGDDEPFIMEMPKYRRPSLKLIWHTVSGQAMMYLKKAGTFILLASIIIWFAGTYPKHTNIEKEFQAKIVLAQTAKDETKARSLKQEFELYKKENSYLGMIGHSAEPLFRPIGYDWRMTVSLLTGLAAKEVVVATMGILYGLGDLKDEDGLEENKGLVNQIKANISLASGVSFIVFCMIYLPCLAASMVFRREAGSWKYLGYLFVLTTTMAWTFSYAAYNITKAFT
ncbi:MAG: ferrous iron transport protein B [Planctomycetota bacterium]|nr:MAG: ferrous iron transport protein B [Planctomycetota bacterium]